MLVFFVCLFAERARRKKTFVCLLVSLALGPYIYLLVGAFASLVYLFFFFPPPNYIRMILKNASLYR